MNLQRLLYWALVLISLTTFVSGIVQIFVPAFILDLIAAEVTPTSKQCFATIGMFMALFGGMLLQVLLSGDLAIPVFLWAGLQKFGAFVAVAIGVAHNVFSPFAMFVACFDLISGILIFAYMKVASDQRSTE